jgi:hypothetical protein
MTPRTHSEGHIHSDYTQKPRHFAGHVGVLAFSRSGDTATDEFGDAKVIRKFGDVPDDLSEL